LKAQVPSLPGQISEPVLLVPTVGAVATNLSFSPSPTTAEISAARVFEEPLIPMWGDPSPAENQAIATALVLFSQRERADDFSALEGFLANQVSYNWYAAVSYALGWEYYHTGYYSKAINAWEEAWNWAEFDWDPKSKELGDRIVGELARMHSRIGGFERLEEILSAVADRPVSGHGAECLAGAKQALWLMKNRPEVSFRCGPLALASIQRHVHGKKGVEKAIFESASTHNGFSLAEVHKLSADLNLGLRMARRGANREFVVPSVVHWKVGHFGAIVGKQRDRYLISDPTFGNSMWVSKTALEQESSGYFLVPEGSLPTGWNSVETREGRGVYGKGVTASSDLNNTTPNDLKARGPCNTMGMAVADMHLMLVSLNIEDTPISFQPPRGPRIDFTITYNQREANQPANFTYSNFGQQWTCNWISYIRDNGTNTPADVEHYVGGGGTEVYTGYSTNTQAFTVNWRTQGTLKRLTTSSYELLFADGSRQIFSQPDGTVGNSRKVFLTQVIDSTGYTNLVQYDSDLRLAKVTDPQANATNLLFYYNSSSMAGLTNTIQRVDDRYGRSATFGYINFLSQLSSVTDVINLTSSFTYEGSFINKLTTPYGVSSFAYGENGRTRYLEETDPEGNKTRVEFNETLDAGIPVAEPGPSVPVNIYSRNYIMNGRNTFYWDKKAMKDAPGDYSKARIYHWLHSANLVSAVGVLESYKEPLESRVWLNYPGQTNDFSATAPGDFALPNLVARVVDGGYTQRYQLYRDSLGNVTNSIDPVGRNFTYVYATNGIDLLEVRQTRGTNNQLLVSYTYNAQHLPLTITDTSAKTTSIGYNSYGQVLSITNTLNEITSFTYDAAGRLLSVDGALAGTSDTVSFTYDAFDRIKTVTGVDGYSVTNSYDAFDRITTNAFPDGTVETVTYNRLDPATIKDREGRITQYEFDGIRQLRKITEATNWVTRLEYCKCGNVKSLTDPMGRITRWSYDIQGRTTAKIYPDDSRIEYTYETNTDRIFLTKNERGQMRTNFWDLDDTLYQVTYSNPSVTPTIQYQYDTNFTRLLAMADGSGTTVFDYYPIASSPVLGAGRLKSVDGPEANDTLVYTYDELGRVNGESIYNAALNTQLNPNPFGGKFYQTGWKYDALGRMTQETNTLGEVGATPDFAIGIFNYAYDGASSRRSSLTYPSGVTSAYSYFGATNDFRLKEIVHRAINNSVISRFNYAHDRTGMITNWMQEVGQTTVSTNEYRLSQNAVKELTGGVLLVNGAANSTNSYAYDLAGNRTSEVKGTNTWRAWFDSLNQIIGKDVGNTVTNRQYEWDTESRLSAIVEGNNRVEFIYNGLGKCAYILEKTSGTTTLTRYFIWSGDRLCEEINSTGSSTFYKIYYEDGYHDLFNLTSCYYTRDHLGSIREVLRGRDGSLGRRYDYDLYGRATSVDHLTFGTPLPPHPGPQLGFTGLLSLPAQGLVMAANRVYDPDLGRWLSRDPIGENGGMNLYRYANNNPVNFVDLDGLCPQKGFAGKDGQFRDANTGAIRNGNGTRVEDQLNPFNSGGLNNAAPIRAGPSNPNRNFNRAAAVNGFQDHHIISDKNALTKNHELLSLAGFNLQSRGNKIFLPTDPSFHPTRSIHIGRHNNSVSARLAEQMDAVVMYGRQNGWGQAEFNQALHGIIAQERSLLRSGARALNINRRPGAQ
jgi:RHS repeat-associated protein